MTGDVDVAPAASEATAPNPAAARASCAQVAVVLACLIGNVISPILVVRGSFGLFLIPISHEFHWPRERVSGVLGLLAIISALTFPLVGRIADQFGPRRPILFGTVVGSACVVRSRLVRRSLRNPGRHAGGDAGACRDLGLRGGMRQGLQPKRRRRRRFLLLGRRG